MDKTILKLSLFTSLFLLSCHQGNIKEHEGKKWDFNKVFDANCCGWTGGDAVYSIPLSDGRSVFIFGDTYLGEVSKDNSRLKTTPVVKNSLVIWDQGRIETLTGSGSNKPLSYFQTTNPDSTWFWPGHGFEHNGQLTFFLAEFKTSGTGIFGFEWIGSSIATIPTSYIDGGKPNIRKWLHGTDIHFGMATLVEDNELFVFGNKAFQVYVAKRMVENLDGWQYWNGQDWSDEGDEAKPIEGLFVSEQFSIFRQNEKYIVLSQAVMLGPEIFAFTSHSILDGWSVPIEIYKTIESKKDSTLFTYNAIAHPQFTYQNELLVSYCVNSTDFASIYRDVNRYRPRFIYVNLSEDNP